MASIGIDLGEDSVKIVELVSGKKNISVAAVHEKKLSSQGTAHDKEIETIEFLRSLFSDKKNAQHQFLMAVRQDRATIRKKVFPFADRIKIQKSLSFEIEEDIPFDPDNCIFDFKTIRYVGNSCETLTVAIPKIHIEKIIALAKDFGIELKIVTLEGFAFSNLIEDWHESPPHVQDQLINVVENKNTDQTSYKAAQLYLNIGHKKTILCASIDGRVVFNRSLMWGADYIIQDMVKRYQSPYNEAQKNLQKISLQLIKKNLTLEEQNIHSLIEKSLRDLVRDIQMSQLEIESELGAQIQEIHFTGGLSQLPHLGAYLTQQLEIPCNAIDLVSPYLTTPLETNISEIKIISQFSLAIGIALESFKKPKNPALQLLKGEFTNQNGFFKTLWINWGQLIQISSLALLALFFWTHFRESFSFDLNEKASEVIETQAKTLIKLPKKKANEKGVNKYISDNSKYNKEMKDLLQYSQMQSALDLLKNLSESSPGKDKIKIDVVQVSIIDDQVKLSGYAESPKEVNLLSSQLARLSINKKITEEPSSLGVLPNRVAFSFSFKSDRGIEKSTEKTTGKTL